MCLLWSRIWAQWSTYMISITFAMILPVRSYLLHFQNRHEVQRDQVTLPWALHNEKSVLGLIRPDSGHCWSSLYSSGELCLAFMSTCHMFNIWTIAQVIGQEWCSWLGKAQASSCQAPGVRIVCGSAENRVPHREMQRSLVNQGHCCVSGWLSSAAIICSLQ